MASLSYLPLHLPFASPAKSLSSALTLLSTTKRPSTVALRCSSSVTVENDSSDTRSAFVVRARNRIGLLQAVTGVFKVLGIQIDKASAEFEDDYFVETFFVTDSKGSKIEDPESLERIRKALVEAVDSEGDDDVVSVASTRGVVMRKPGLGLEFGGNRGKAERMFRLMDGFLRNDPIGLQKDILHHVEYTLARSRFSFDDFEAYQALSLSVKDRLVERSLDTQIYFKKKDPKRVYFLSLEFLMGRSLSNSVINLGLQDQYAEALNQLGFEYEVLAEQEGDAALGNGGLARLSACQMDSLATLDYPAWGYGLRYEYGLFRQVIVDGHQQERPDFWLNYGNPWEIERIHLTYPVKFYGNVDEETKNGQKCKVWVPGEMVEAVAYDNPIPGYGTRNTLTLRLWAAKPSDLHNMESFNTGDYIDAVVNRQNSETISNVLYPDDRSYQGKELRLKQQYFFVSASMQDIIRRFKDVHSNFNDFPEKVALQLNDTHPSLAIVEVIRVLVDEEHLDWDRAWDIVTQIFSFTTHTVSTAGLEKVPVDLLGSVLPRHLQIIYDINHNFMEDLKKRIGLNYDRMSRMSIVEEGAVKTHSSLELLCRGLESPLNETLQKESSNNAVFPDTFYVFIHFKNQRLSPFTESWSGASAVRNSSFPHAQQSIRMAHLSIVCSHSINGVSRVHSELLTTKLFKDFYELWPEKFQFKTNGVTQRRWIVVSNPSLSALISKWLGTEAWIRDVELLTGLRDHASNTDLHQEWNKVRMINKLRLAEYIESLSGIKVSLDAMFDVQIKRIHAYKRQFLNLLGIIHRYDCIKNMDQNDRRKVVPRVCVIGGKAAPGYEIAKKIIKLCHAVAERINNDNDVGDLLKLVFIPDYNVSVAEIVIPGADLSQHISTAGHEASGTGGMKFLMNGCLLLATEDGATNEIVEEIGAENMFLCGAKIDEVPGLREKGAAVKAPLQFSRVVRMIREGYFGSKEYFQSLCDTVETESDHFLLGADFGSYLEAQTAADKAFVDKEKWTRMSILSTAGSGRFSSDQTVEEYAEKTWGVQPCRCPF